MIIKHQEYVKGSDDTMIYSEDTWQKVNNKTEYFQILCNLIEMKEKEPCDRFQVAIARDYETLIKEMLRRTSYNWRVL